MEGAPQGFHPNSKCELCNDQSTKMNKDIEKIHNDIHGDKGVKELIKAIELKLAAYAVYFAIATAIFSIVGAWMVYTILDTVKDTVKQVREYKDPKDSRDIRDSRDEPARHEKR